VRCDGLALFLTANGAYTGNIIATEAVKREMISRYLPLSLLDTVKDAICQQLVDLMGQFVIDVAQEFLAAHSNGLITNFVFVLSATR
jgi:hypothetical protein